jgi:tetratricopeptide (TPR) repeat protein
VVDTAKLDEAKAYLSEALSIDPNYTEALALLGTAQALRGEPPQSLDKIASTRFCATAELGRAYGHVRAGRLDEATAGLERILNAHPGFLHARGYLGELLALRGQHDKAIAVFDAYLAEVPAQPWVLVQRGYSKSRQKDFAGAIADTEAALTAAPGSPAFRLELASRYVDARKLDAAEATLNTLMGEQPDLALALTRLGYIKLLQNKDDQAIALTERALRYRGNAQRPRDIAYAHLNLARAYGHRGDLEKSLRFLAEALRLADVPLTEVEADPLLVSLRADPRYQRLTSTTNQSQRTQ